MIETHLDTPTSAKVEPHNSTNYRETEHSGAVDKINKEEAQALAERAAEIAVQRTMERMSKRERISAETNTNRTVINIVDKNNATIKQNGCTLHLRAHIKHRHTTNNPSTEDDHQK